MEQSAFEAVMIGVNVFVFIVALTAAVMLMSSVLDMVNYANENITTGMNGSLAENIGVVHERIYSGEQVLSYCRRLMEGNKNYNFKIKFKNSNFEAPLRSYILTRPLANYIDKQFELQYKGIVNQQEAYVFVEK